MATLKVTVHEARDLPIMDRATGLADPYVVVKLDDMEHTTDIARRTRNPVWEHDVRFDTADLLVLQEDPLEIRVYDHDIISRDDIVGMVLLDCNSIIYRDNPAVSGWFPLIDSDAGLHGDIRLTIRIKFHAAENPLAPALPERYVRRLDPRVADQLPRTPPQQQQQQQAPNSNNNHNNNGTTANNGNEVSISLSTMPSVVSSGAMGESSAAPAQSPHQRTSSNPIEQASLSSPSSPYGQRTAHQQGGLIPAQTANNTPHGKKHHISSSSRHPSATPPSRSSVAQQQQQQQQQLHQQQSVMSAFYNPDNSFTGFANGSVNLTMANSINPGMLNNNNNNNNNNASVAMSFVDNTSGLPLPSPALLPFFVEQDLDPLQAARVDHPTLAAEEEGVFVFSVWRLDPAVFRVESTHSMMEELIVKSDPEHVRFTNLRSSRSINDARVIQLFKLSGKVRRQLARKVVELQCNAVLGYVEEFDMEPNGIIVRAYGTPCVVSQVKYVDEREMHAFLRSKNRYLQSSVAAAYQSELMAQQLQMSPLPLSHGASPLMSGGAVSNTNVSGVGSGVGPTYFPPPSTIAPRGSAAGSTPLLSNNNNNNSGTSGMVQDGQSLSSSIARAQPPLTPPLHHNTPTMHYSTTTSGVAGGNSAAVLGGSGTRDHLLPPPVMSLTNDSVTAAQMPPETTSTAVQSPAATPVHRPADAVGLLRPAHGDGDHANTASSSFTLDDSSRDAGFTAVLPLDATVPGHSSSTSLPHTAAVTMDTATTTATTASTTASNVTGLHGPGGPLMHSSATTSPSFNRSIGGTSFDGAIVHNSIDPASAAAAAAALANMTTTTPSAVAGTGSGAASAAAAGAVGAPATSYGLVAAVVSASSTGTPMYAGSPSDLTGLLSASQIQQQQQMQAQMQSSQLSATRAGLAEASVATLSPSAVGLNGLSSGPSNVVAGPPAQLNSTLPTSGAAAPGATTTVPATAGVAVGTGSTALAGPSRVMISMLTVKDLPAGSIHHIGGYICARSVKIVSRVKSRQMISQERDAWWMELREELRANARAFHCNTVLGYEEETQYHEDVVLLSLYGTAVMLDVSVEALRAGPEFLFRQQKQRVAAKRSCTLLHLYEGPRRKGGQQSLGLLAGEVGDLLLHHVCSICHNKPVPEVLLAACTLPVELSCEAPPRLVQVAVSKTKPNVKGVDLAMAVSQALPFIEFALHKQLLFNLRLQQMNACFSLRVSVVVGPDAIIGTLTGSGCRLAGLPVPKLPRMSVVDPLIANKESVVKLRDVIASRHRRHYNDTRNSSSSSSSSSSRSSSSSSSSSSTDSSRSSALSASAGGKPLTTPHSALTKGSERSGSALRLGSTDDVRAAAYAHQQQQQPGTTAFGAMAPNLASSPTSASTSKRRKQRHSQHHHQQQQQQQQSSHQKSKRSRRHRRSRRHARSNKHSRDGDNNTKGSDRSSASSRSASADSQSGSPSHTTTTSSAGASGSNSSGGDAPRRKSRKHRRKHHRKHHTRNAANSNNNNNNSYSIAAAAVGENVAGSAPNTSSAVTQSASSATTSTASSRTTTSSSTSSKSSRSGTTASSSSSSSSRSASSSSASSSNSWVPTESSESDEDVYAPADEWHTSSSGVRTKTSDYVVKIDDVEEADMMLGMVDSTNFEDGVLLTLPYVPDSANAFDWQERIVLDRRYSRASSAPPYVGGVNSVSGGGGVSGGVNNNSSLIGNAAGGYGGARGSANNYSVANGTYRGDGGQGSLGGAGGDGSGAAGSNAANAAAATAAAGRTALTTRLLNEYCADAKRAFVHRACRMAMRTTQPLRLRVVNLRVEMMFVPNSADLQLRLEGCVMVASSLGARQLRALEDRAFRVCMHHTLESLSGLWQYHQQQQQMHLQSQTSHSNAGNNNAASTNGGGGSLTPAPRQPGTPLVTAANANTSGRATPSLPWGPNTPVLSPMMGTDALSSNNNIILNNSNTNLSFTSPQLPPQPQLGGQSFAIPHNSSLQNLTAFAAAVAAGNQNNNNNNNVTGKVQMNALLPLMEPEGPAYLDARRLFVTCNAPFSMPYVQDITLPPPRVWSGVATAFSEDTAAPPRHTSTYAEYRDSRGSRTASLSRRWHAFVRATGQSIKGLVDRATGGTGDRIDRRLQQQRRWLSTNASIANGEGGGAAGTSGSFENVSNVNGGRNMNAHSSNHNNNGSADASMAGLRDANFSHPAARLPPDIAQLLQLIPVVLFTPLDYVAGRSIVRYLGRLSQHFIREDYDTDTGDDLNVFFQRAEMEIMCMVQAVVRLMGGNALLKHRIVYHEICDSDGSGSAFLFATVTGDVVQVSDTEYGGPQPREGHGKKPQTSSNNNNIVSGMSKSHRAGNRAGHHRYISREGEDDDDSSDDDSSTPRTRARNNNNDDDGARSSEEDRSPSTAAAANASGSRRRKSRRNASRHRSSRRHRGRAHRHRRHHHRSSSATTRSSSSSSHDSTSSSSSSSSAMTSHTVSSSTTANSGTPTPSRSSSVVPQQQQSSVALARVRLDRRALTDDSRRAVTAAGPVEEVARTKSADERIDASQLPK